MSLLYNTNMNTNTDQEEQNPMNAKRVCNVLCLHGKGNNAQSFQQILKPLEEKISLQLLQVDEQFRASDVVNFDYITAPFPMEVGDKDNNASTSTTTTATTISSTASNVGFQWWTLPPGVRSFNAKEYQGFEQSAEKIYQQLQQKDYDFIIGHSQGAILLSALLATSSSNSSSSTTSTSSTQTSKEKRNDLFQFKSVRGYLLNGCAWPNPYTDQMTTFQYEHNHKNDSKHEYDEEEEGDKNPHPPQILFVIGERDKINPPEGAERVKHALKQGGLKDYLSTCYHPGGHSVPVQNEEALNEMSNWFMNLLMQRS